MAKIDLVYDTLKSQILNGDLPPGCPIDKAAIGDRLTVSRQPIAAAIDRLARDGLVDVVPQLGSFVSRLDRAVIADWFLIRTALEIEFVVRFANSAGPGQVHDLRVNLAGQEEAVDRRDVKRLYELDLDFHRIITSHSPAPEGWAILDRAQTQLGRIRRLLLPTPGRMQQTLIEHHDILTGIEAHKPGTAGRAMRAHIATVARMTEDIIAANPDLVSPS